MLRLISVPLLAVLHCLADLEEVYCVALVVVLVVLNSLFVIGEDLLGFAGLVGAAEDVGSGDFEVVLEGESLSEFVGFLLAHSKGEEVGEGDGKDGDEEETPEGDDDADDSAHGRLGVDVTVADGGHRDDNVPDVVLQEAEVLVGVLGELTLEYAEVVAEDDSADDEGEQEELVGLLLHD